MGPKYTIAQMIAHQKEMIDYCVNNNMNGQWPDKDPVWRRYEEMSDAEYAEEIEDMNRIAAEANMSWPLDQLQIDDSRALLRLVEDPFPAMEEDGVKKGDKFVLLGEIPQAPGHTVVSHLHSGRIYSMCHDSDFVLCSPADEVAVIFTTATEETQKLETDPEPQNNGKSS